ncbi:MAG: hypothetical protein U1F35_09250 [Steroidobacteraceae bacterium]
MANLTLVIDDEILLRARKRALDHGTSVNAVLRRYLETYAGREDGVVAMQAFIRRAAACKVRSQKSWTRDELHEQ